MAERMDAGRAIEELSSERVLVLDGAMGTMLQQQCLSRG